MLYMISNFITSSAGTYQTPVSLAGNAGFNVSESFGTASNNPISASALIDYIFIPQGKLILGSISSYNYTTYPSPDFTSSAATKITYRRYFVSGAPFI